MNGRPGCNTPNGGQIIKGFLQKELIYHAMSLQKPRLTQKTTPKAVDLFKCQFTCNFETKTNGLNNSVILPSVKCTISVSTKDSEAQNLTTFNKLLQLIETIISLKINKHILA